MVEFKLDKLVKEINHYFDKGYQYVFWYDPDKEFADEVREDNKELLDQLDAQLMTLEQKEQFKAKLVLLDKKNTTQSYLVYIKANRPHLQLNYLADMERYGHLFSAKASDIIFQQLAEQLNWAGDTKKRFVRKYSKFFRAKQRRQAFIRHYDQRLDDQPELAILSSLADLSRFDENELLMLVLASGIRESDNKIIQLFSKYDVLPIFWQLYDRYFGENGIRSLSELISGVIITSLYSQLNEKVPVGLKKYEFTNYTNAQVFTKRFSDSREYTKLYDRITSRVWNDLGLTEYLKNEPLQELVRIKNFKQIDELLLTRLRENFKDDGTIVDGDETINVIGQVMHGVDTFNPEFGFLKEAYRILSYRPHYYDNWQDMLDDYTKDGYQVDSDYRWLVNYYNTIPETNREKYQRIKRLTDSYYEKEVLDNSVREWTGNFDLREVVDGLRQTNFFKEKVAGFKERIIVIISDAFRYEAAMELKKRLDTDDRITTKMSHLVTGLPSVTYMGMPMLLPHKKLSWDGANVLVDGQLANNASKRKKILQQWDENNDLIELDDILKASSKEVKSIVANKNVVYIYHNQVDAIGDNLKTENDTFKATDEAIDELREAIQKLRTNSVAHVIVTADHGFIYREAPILEQDKIDISAKDYHGKISPRYLITEDDIGNVPGVLKTTLGESLGNDDNTNVYYPTTVSVFKSQGGKNYVHGGASLQEMVVPVLDLKMNSAASKADLAEIRLAATQFSINSWQMSLHFNQVKPISDVVKPRKFNVFFMDSYGQIISNIATINANKNKSSINTSLVAKMVIQKRHYDRSQSYYLVIQPLTGSVEHSRYRYTMDLIGYDDLFR